MNFNIYYCLLYQLYSEESIDDQNEGFFSNIEMIVCKINIKNRSCNSVERDYESDKKRRWRLTDSAFIDHTLFTSTDLIL